MSRTLQSNALLLHLRTSLYFVSLSSLPFHLHSYPLITVPPSLTIYITTLYSEELLAKLKETDIKSKFAEIDKLLMQNKWKLESMDTFNYDDKSASRSTLDSSFGEVNATLHAVVSCPVVSLPPLCLADTPHFAALISLVPPLSFFLFPLSLLQASQFKSLGVKSDAKK
jgi:hypothetical protein